MRTNIYVGRVQRGAVMCRLSNSFSFLFQNEQVIDFDLSTKLKYQVSAANKNILSAGGRSHSGRVPFETTEKFNE